MNFTQRTLLFLLLCAAPAAAQTWDINCSAGQTPQQVTVQANGHLKAVMCVDSSGTVYPTAAYSGGGGGSLPSGSQGNVLTNISAGSGTTYAVIPNVIHSAGFTSPTLQGLIALCGSDPCEIHLDPSSTSITADNAVIGSTSVVNVIDHGVTITCNGTTGGKCIAGGQLGSLTCAAKSNNGCFITSSPSANITSLVTNDDQSGAQTNFIFRGFTLVPSGTATLSGPTMSVVSIEGTAGIRDLAITCNPGGAALGFQDSSSGAGDNNAIYLDNVWVFGSNSTHCTGLRIWGPTGTGTGHLLNLVFNGGAVVDIGNMASTGGNCPNGDDCLVDIDGSSGTGSGTNFVGNITFIGTYFETSGSTGGGSFFEARNFRGVELINVEFNGGPAQTNCIWLAQTAGGVNTGYFKATGQAKGSICTNQVNNTINSKVISQAGSTSITYLYPGVGIGNFIDGPETITGALIAANYAIPGASSGNLIKADGTGSTSPTATVNGVSCTLGSSCTVADSTKVPTTTTVNGHALSSNVVVSASDLTTGTLPHTQLPALVSGDIPANAANTSGNAGTATALAATPTLCASGNAPTGILANGNATGCTTITGGGSSVSFLVADTTGSASNTLANTGMSFSLAANTTYTLDCTILFTVSTTSSVGLTLGVSGPGTPTQVTLMRTMNTTATAFRVDSTAGASWGAKIGATATTVTALSYAYLSGTIENGSSAGTMNIQFANIGTTGTTTVKRGSFCKLQ